MVGLAATSRGSTHPTERFHDRLNPRCGHGAGSYGRRLHNGLSAKGPVAILTPNPSPGDDPFAPSAHTKQRNAPWPFVLSVLTLFRWLSILTAIEIRRLGAANMTYEQFHQVAKALADPQRFAILERIARERGELACKALVQEFPISQATISHHLKELSEAGLIDCRRKAQCAFLEPPAARDGSLSRGARPADGVGSTADKLN